MLVEDMTIEQVRGLLVRAMIELEDAHDMLGRPSETPYREATRLARQRAINECRMALGWNVLEQV